MAKLPESTTKIAHQLSEVNSMATQAAIGVVMKNDGRVSGIYTAALGTIGALQVVAALVGWPGEEPTEETDPKTFAKLINPDSMLFAALLVNAMCSGGAVDARADEVMGQKAIGANFHIDFGPSTMYEAMQNFEKFTGRPVSDKTISPYLIKGTLEAVAESDKPLAEFLSQHRSTPGGLH